MQTPSLCTAYELKRRAGNLAASSPWTTTCTESIAPRLVHMHKVYQIPKLRVRPEEAL